MRRIWASAFVLAGGLAGCGSRYEPFPAPANVDGEPDGAAASVAPPSGVEEKTPDAGASADDPEVATTGPFGLPGMLITMRTNSGRWVRPDIDGSPTSNKLRAARDGVGTWEVFSLETPKAATTDEVCLRSYANGKYVSAEAGGTRSLVADRDRCGPWERFRLHTLSSTVVALQSMANSKFVTAGANGTEPLVASSSAIGPAEQLTLERVVDVFVAAKAYAKNYPNDVKLLTANTNKNPNPVLVAKEIETAGTIWTYWLLADSTCRPGIGFPGWDKYGIIYYGHWESFSCFGTKPECNHGSHWVNGFPRSRRYPNVDVIEKSPVNHGDWLDIGFNGDKNACGQTYSATADNWGVHYVPTMMELGGSMGRRWVLTTDVYATEEVFLLDLGPAVNVFAPKYGFVGYGGVLYSKIVPDERYYPRICDW